MKISNEFLKEQVKNTQLSKRINNLAKKYKDKNIYLYGAGTFLDLILEEYNLSALKIKAISDRKFETEEISEYKNIKTIKPSKLFKRNDTIVLVIQYDSYHLINFLEKEFKKNSTKSKVLPLVKKGFKDLFIELFNEKN